MRAWSLLIFGVFIAIFMNPYLNPKVVNSPKPEQRVIAEHSVPNTTNCHFATSQGRRQYQEDRVACDLHLNILFLGGDGGLEEVKVGVVAVFDGHIGDHASDMASRIFLDKFQLKNLGEQTSNYMESLKSSLVKTIEDIDTDFSKAAVEHQLYSGSTAVVALIYNNHVLVAHVGDSKALLCSRNMQSHESGKGAASLAGLLAKELTRDHNALRLDEKARVEASGGIFTPNLFLSSWATSP